MAKAGHVTGGQCFGYTNRRVAAGHVERTLNEAEAAVIRRIFALSVEGHGQKAIAKILNAAGVPSPRAQRGRSQTWAPTSVREVLFRDVYRGRLTWNRTRKRDQWGMQHQAARPVSDWLDIPAPQLRIVPDDVWTAAHARLAAARAVYMRGTGGRPFGRPPLGDPSKYLLTNLALCGCCHGPLKVRSRSHGHGRKHFYGGAGYHDRGRTVCANRSDVPMRDTDEIVIEALLDEVLDASILHDAIEAALALIQRDVPADRLARVECDLATVEQERTRLATAIAEGGHLGGLLQTLQARETRRADLQTERTALRARRRVEASESDRIRGELVDLARVLAEDPTHARPIVSAADRARDDHADRITPVAADGARIAEWAVRARDRGGVSLRAGVPNGIRTRVLALKGPRPRPLDDGDD
jgi:site-specific DNA recombinase